MGVVILPQDEARMPPEMQAVINRLRDEKTPPKAYAPGETICHFCVPTRAKPWSVPPKLRRKNPRLTTYQEVISRAAAKAMERRPPYGGAVHVRYLFRLTPWRTMPDGTNLVKSTEDALQGHCFIDDRQVRSTIYEYDPHATENLITILVKAYRPQWLDGGIRTEAANGQDD